MSLAGSIWNQTILNVRSGESVAFGIDLRGQEQAYARFKVEPHDGGRAPDVSFQNTTIDFARSDSQNCDLREQGPDDVVMTRVLASDSLSCSIETIMLKSSVAPLPTKAVPKQH
jgi:hypothetical protein